MECTFQEEIMDWDSWGKVFQSIPAFEGLIRKIFKRENLPCKHIYHLTAGSNAVFKVDNFVIKIFAPVESGINTEIDYICEILGMNRAISLGINIPKVIVTASMEDKYLFRYIIMEYIEGADARKILKDYSLGGKLDIVRQLKENIGKMNTIIEEKYPTLDVKERALGNTRWNKLSDGLVSQLKELVEDYPITEEVYVHGDITGDNVMITEEGKLYIIDFADGRIAPKEYEFPPILFDLFDFNKAMIKEFVGEINIDEFADKCFYGVLMHEYGVYFVELICERILGIKVEELSNINEVKVAIKSFLVESVTTT